MAPATRAWRTPRGSTWNCARSGNARSGYAPGSAERFGQQPVGMQPGLVAPYVGHHHDLVRARLGESPLELLPHAAWVADHHQRTTPSDRVAFAGVERVGVDLFRAGQRGERTALDAQPGQVHGRGQTLGP